MNYGFQVQVHEWAVSNNTSVKEYSHQGTLVTITTETFDDGIYPVAIVMKQDGFLESVPVDLIKIVELLK